MKSDVAWHIHVMRVDKGIQFAMQYRMNGVTDSYVACGDDDVLWLTVLFVTNWQAVSGEDINDELAREAAARLNVDWLRSDELRASSTQRLRQALFMTLGLEDVFTQNSWDIVTAVELLDTVRPSHDQMLNLLAI